MAKPNDRAAKLRKAMDMKERAGGPSSLIRLEDGWQFDKVEPGQRIYDIVGYTVRTKGDRMNPVWGLGERASWRPFSVHTNLGVRKEMIACPACVGEDCHVCQTGARLQARGKDWKELGAYRSAPRRALCAISRGTKVVIVQSDFLFGEALDAWIESDIDRNSDFDDPVKGQAIKVKWEKSSFPTKEGGQGNCTKAMRVDGTGKRGVKLGAGAVDKMLDLDAALIIHDAAYIKKLMGSAVSVRVADDIGAEVGDEDDLDLADGDDPEDDEGADLDLGGDDEGSGDDDLVDDDDVGDGDDDLGDDDDGEPEDDDLDLDGGDDDLDLGDDDEEEEEEEEEEEAVGPRGGKARGKAPAKAPAKPPAGKAAASRLDGKVKPRRQEDDDLLLDDIPEDDDEPPARASKPQGTKSAAGKPTTGKASAKAPAGRPATGKASAKAPAGKPRR